MNKSTSRNTRAAALNEFFFKIDVLVFGKDQDQHDVQLTMVLSEKRPVHGGYT